MSSIKVEGLDSAVTEKQLKLLFFEFGKITSIDYKQCKPKKCSGVAIINFQTANASKQALDYDGVCIKNHEIKVSVYSKVQKKNKREFLFNFTEILLILLVACISFLTHFPNISFPGEVVFDETHFGGFLTGYITGERFFDIHPPLAKLILAGWAKYACNYTGNFNFSKHVYTNDVDYAKIRVLPCFCGSMVAPILTSAMLLRRCSHTSSVMVGLLFAFDFTSIVQSRLILTDAIVYFFVAMTIFYTCMLSRRETWHVVIMGGIFGSAAFCSKFAAGGALFLVALANIRLCIRRRHGFLILCFRGAVCAFILVSMLFGTIYLHLLLTPKIGYGDQYTIRNFRRMSYPKQCLYLLWDMYRYNRDLGFDHPYQSRWYQWPFFMATPTLLWSRNGLLRAICIFNNPVSAIVSIIGAILCARWLNLDWFLSWCVSYLPFAAVKRCTWTYHYEIPLMFGICGFCFVLDRCPKRIRNILQTIVFISLIAAFIYWMPWAYAIKVSRERLDKMVIWNRTRTLWNMN